MEQAKKLLAQGKPLAALARLKEILKTNSAWQVHELIGATTDDLISDFEG